MQIVVFTGGLYPEPVNAKKYFENKKIDFVIAADSGLYTLEKYNDFFDNRFQPNFILGDMDSIEDKSLLSKYPNTSVEEFSCYKDYTDTELALEKANNISKSNKNEKNIITLVGGAGGRIDHLLGIYDTFSTKIHADVWLYEEQALYFIHENDEIKIYNLCLKDNVSISRLYRKINGGKIISDGLEWEYSFFRKKGMPSISNRISSRNYENGMPVLLNVKKGEYLMIVPIKSLVEITNHKKEK